MQRIVELKQKTAGLSFRVPIEQINKQRRLGQSMLSLQRSPVSRSSAHVKPLPPNATQYRQIRRHQVHLLIHNHIQHCWQP